MPATANGFRYPAATDTPDVPRDVGYLAADVESKLGTLAAGWTAYIPAIFDGTATTIAGQYKQVGKTVHVAIYYAWLTLGSTDFAFSLPVAARAGFQQALSAFLYDSSANNYYAAAARIGNADSRVRPLASAGRVTNLVPFTWAASDQIWITGTYEAA